MKTGKTTTASAFPKALLLAFEHGYAAIPGVMAAPINRWSEFKQILKQLKEDKAHETYSNIILDTTDIAYDLCEKYICSQHGVSSIKDIPYGQGWNLAAKEFDEALRSIPQMGFGLILISHSQEKTFKDEQTGEEYSRIVPTLGNKPRLIVDRMSDVIAFARPVETEEGTQTMLYMRGTSRFIAGSRFKYTPDSIVFTYDNLVKAINDAIDKQAAEHDNKFVTDEKESLVGVESYDFPAMMKEFKSLTTKIQKSVDKEEFKTAWAPKIQAIVEEYLGVGRKVNDCTAQQAEQLDLILADLKDLLANGIEVE